eukprot:CAMPEP_0201733900 /NCGR_PEP_ID=MMETSP0593-20130828/32749_1 /ASSEMBLY_ACC=CAM_ASM_000672 /TAXON_ID=267983 /ORGANISM="Skeletonema japonicum, Strain CCMP2506" /LENGTH=43 /DNA_ID= /DNA_START= /DNA_END= /DNA_ORIENTATION=
MSNNLSWITPQFVTDTFGKSDCGYAARLRDTDGAAVLAFGPCL